MRYSLEHLKVVYKAGKQGLGFDQVLKFLELIDGGESVSSFNGGADVYPGVRRRGRPVGSGAGGASRPRGRQSGLGNKILTHLLAAGEQGSHVRDIAAAVGSRQPNVVAWVYSTGKKLFATKELKKVAPATFAYIPRRA